MDASVADAVCLTDIIAPERILTELGIEADTSHNWEGKPELPSFRASLST